MFSNLNKFCMEKFIYIIYKGYISCLSSHVKLDFIWSIRRYLTNMTYITTCHFCAIGCYVMEITVIAIHLWVCHDDVIKWKHFPRYWPFVRRIHRSPVNSPHKGQWSGALMFTLICTWINGWVNNDEAGDLRLYRAHSDVIVMHMCAFNFHPSRDKYAFAL